MFVGLEEVFIGMEEVRVLAWRRCVYLHGGGVFIGMEEVCLLAWRRCVYWLR